MVLDPETPSFPRRYVRPADRPRDEAKEDHRDPLMSRIWFMTPTKP
jgi:hypothetical protein